MRTTALLLLASLFMGSGSTTNVTHDKLRQKAFDRALTSVIKVWHPQPTDDNPNATYFCTGFIVDAAKGLALTARHCVPDKNDVPVYTQQYSRSQLTAEQPFLSEVVKRNDQLALVKIPVMAGPPVEFADDVQIFDDVISLGYGFGDMKALKRNVAALEGGDVLVDNALIPGMSGGPSVDLDGKVVLINQASANGVGIGCGVKEMKDFIKAK